MSKDIPIDESNEPEFIVSLTNVTQEDEDFLESFYSAPSVFNNGKDDND